jgi:diketogulonate reductase-like aldo/keto reductase
VPRFALGMWQAEAGAEVRHAVRWALQHDLAVIPQSVSRERVLANADVVGFELGKDDTAALDALDEVGHFAWAPTGVP